ncbi:acyltransferase family protein [Allohahella marinimesophila]|uniref:Acyltransferase family protein n=1 Tax=Allohahella marinimesophila TaxID=1054972 RepID=A0ABP7PRZ6_9GAMM
MISGFLITRLIYAEIERTGTFRFDKFYLRRVKRLLPALLVVLLATTLVATVILSPLHLERFGSSLAAAVLSISNFFFLAEADYFDSATRLKPLLHTWSLSVEEQFYLIWPLTLLLLLRYIKVRWIPWLLVGAGGVSLYLNFKFADGNVSLLSTHAPWLANYLANGKGTIFYLLPFRVFEFIIGALTVWFMHVQPKRQLVSDVLMLVGLGLIGYSIFFFHEDILFPAHSALLPCLGTALVIHSGGNSRLVGMLQNPLMVWIGLISYSLYLVHWPVTVFWRYLMISGEFSLIDQFGIVALSFALAYATYRWVETPARNGKLALTAPRWVVATVAITGFNVALGMHMQVTEGWNWRVDNPVAVVIEGDGSDFSREHYGGYGFPYYGAVAEAEQDPEGADIVLIGDSHGRHYAEGIYRELAEPFGRSMFIASGTSCLHLPGFTRNSVGQDWNRLCPSAFKKAMSYINSAEKPPLVIVSHAWLYQLEMADKLDQYGKPLHQRIDGETLFQGILELKAQIAPSQLVVIGNVPSTNGVDLFDVLFRPNLPALTGRDYDSFTRTGIDQGELKKNRVFNRQLRQLAEDSGAFVFVDPFDALCQKQACENLDPERHLIYSDQAHLSQDGSRHVISRLRSSFLRQPPLA